VIADAIDTAITLGWAFLIWLVILAFFAGAALYTVVVAVGATARGVWRACAWLYSRLRPELPPGDSQPPTSPERRTAAHVPSWAHTAHYDDRSAA